MLVPNKLLQSNLLIQPPLSGDNTEKIWAHQFLAKPKMIAAGSQWGAIIPQGVQDESLMKVCVRNP